MICSLNGFFGGFQRGCPRPLVFKTPFDTNLIFIVMDNVISFLKNFINSLPIWAKVVVSLLICILVAFFVFFTLVSCGSTVRATISNKAEGVTTTVSITTSNPTSVTVSPDTSLNFPDTLKTK